MEVRPTVREDDWSQGEGLFEERGGAGDEEDEGGEGGGGGSGLPVLKREDMDCERREEYMFAA